MGIYFDLLAEMINIRESLGYKDNVENIDAALKDKVDLNMVPPVELRNFSHHPLEVTEKAWEEYRARIKVEKKKT